MTLLDDGTGESPLPGLRGDVWIARMVRERRMIDPFEDRQVREREVARDSGGAVYAQRAISYGLSSYGYDIRVADDYKVFTNVYATVIDPKNVDARAFAPVAGQGHCIIPPNSFALARSIERFEVPEDVLGVVLGKSSYARCGIIVCCTPLEPGWRGHLTIEISNTTPLPAKVYSNEGIAQVLFFQSPDKCRTTYADRDGKYQDQGPEVVLPRM